MSEQDTHSAFARSGATGGGVIWISGPDADNRDALAQALGELLAERGSMIMLLPDRNEDGTIVATEPAKLGEGAVKAAEGGLTVIIGADGPADVVSKARDEAKQFALFLVYDGNEHADIAQSAFADVRLDTAVLDGAAACELCLAFLDNWQ